MEVCHDAAPFEPAPIHMPHVEALAESSVVAAPMASKAQASNIPCLSETGATMQRTMLEMQQNIALIRSNLLAGTDDMGAS